MNVFSRIFTFLFLLSGFLGAQPDQTEAERLLYVRNKIKTIEISSLRLNRDIDKRTLLNERIQIDREGHILEQTFYDSTGLEMMKWTQLWSGSRQTGRVFCIYRDTVAKTVFVYNDKGFPLEEITENADGAPLCKFRYTCDAQGRIIEAKEEIFPELQAYVKQAYKSDLQGFLILRFMDESKGHAWIHYSYTYSKKGELEKISETKKDTVDFAWVNIEYTKDGFRKGFTVRHLNGKKFKCYYAFDGHGNLKDEAKYYSFNTVVIDQERNSYVVDSQGNIKKKLKYRTNNKLYALYNYSYSLWE
jgi:hypothetical protein